MEMPNTAWKRAALSRARFTQSGQVKAFCAYGATEYGADSAQIAKADAIITVAQRKVTAAIVAAEFAAAMARIARLN